MSKKDLKKVDKVLAFLEFVCFVVMLIFYFKEIKIGFAWVAGSFSAFLLAHALLHPIKDEEDDEE